ncbi:MAG: hypothetical protein WCE81_08850 [Halobacteriota archaeon]
MNIKNGLICVLIVAVLSLCTFNSVAAAPASKLTPDIHSNYAADVRGGQQTYLITTLNFGNATTVTMWVGQYVWLTGVLSSTPPTSWCDTSHGIANKTVNIQNMNSDGKTWSTVATRSTGNDRNSGVILVQLTPKAAGVYTYRMIYYGDSQYAPAVSNVVTLTVTNVAIS